MTSHPRGSRRAKTRSSPGGLINPTRDHSKKMTDTSPLFQGIISGQRRRDHAAVADRADRIAGGLQRLGVKPGDSLCILMPPAIPLIQAPYAAMLLGAYAVPINCP